MTLDNYIAGAAARSKYYLYAITFMTGSTTHFACRASRHVMRQMLLLLMLLSVDDVDDDDTQAS